MLGEEKLRRGLEMAEGPTEVEEEEEEDAERREDEADESSMRTSSDWAI